MPPTLQLLPPTYPVDITVFLGAGYAGGKNDNIS